MRADLVGLGVRLGWVAADEKEEPALAAVMERLRHEGERVLLIFDNAIDANALKPYLPRGGAARVLVTSSAHAWRGVAQPVEIRLWPKEIGADYLVARTGREVERAAAEALSEALGGLPLAHEQAAAYCEDLGIGLAEYRRRFEAATAQFLDDKDYAPAEYHPEHQAEYHDRLTVAGTFRLAIEEAAKRHPAAEPLIVHCALLAPEPIPLFLFLEAREKFGEPLASALAGDGLDKAIAALRAFALADRETIADERDPSIRTDCIRLHRLVRQVAAGRCEGERRESVRRGLMGALAAVYPDYIWRDPEAWPRARRLDALALALVDAVPPKGAEEPAANLLVRAGQYRQYVLAAYADARPLYERSLAIHEKVLGPEHPDTATSLNNLACLVRDMGLREEAEPLFRRAIAIGEKILGGEHPDVATRWSNLACLLRDAGRTDDAEALFRRAVTIGEKALGPEHPLTQRYQSHYARLLLMTERPEEASRLGHAALTTHERVNSPDHPWTKDSARVTADALDALGRTDEGKALREKYGLA
jgi:tetratricopeptide (TPR) repeat protein